MGPVLWPFALFVRFCRSIARFALCLHTGVSVSAASEANGEKGTKLLLQVIRLILVYVSMVAMLVQVVTFRIILTSYYLFFHLFDVNIVFYCISVGKAINVTRAGVAGCRLPQVGIVYPCTQASRHKATLQFSFSLFYCLLFFGMVTTCQ